MTPSIDQALHQFLTLLLIRTLLPNLTFYRIAREQHRTFATGAASQQRTLTPPDTWSCPTLGLATVLMLRPISPNLNLSCFGTFEFRTSLGTSYLLVDNASFMYLIFKIKIYNTKLYLKFKSSTCSKSFINTSHNAHTSINTFNILITCPTYYFEIIHSIPLLM